MRDSGLPERKKRARDTMQALLSDVTAPDRQSWSKLIQTHVRALPEWSSCREVLIFSSLPVEVDTAPLIESAKGAGKAIFLPRIHGAELSFLRWQGGPLETHAYGMPEPPEDAAPWIPASAGQDVTLIICPGLAFDASGRRLGRGKGFYDRFLADVRRNAPQGSVSATGVCFHVQVLERVPAGPNDEIMDAVISERGLLARASRVR